ncbi:MAG: metal ABC transporter permease [Gemmatimonadetes bacterium]|nr:metal ABC transporter permease [Gemmatimonadota bacterium]
MLPPFVACMVLVAMHAYLGLHVIARGVIFVDLALAQMAALGATTGFLFGVAPDSRTGFLVALGFAMLGAAIFALTRGVESIRIPQEAIIGIVYIVASAAAILVADRAPRGAEHIKDMLSGSILWVGWPTIVEITAAYLVVGVFQYLCRHRFLTISFDPGRAFGERWSVRLWDFLFYASFGLVITISVTVAGVLMVFTFLVVPAVIAFLFTERQRWMAVISWTGGALASAVGLGVSYAYDFPTGPAIVCTFGLLLLLAWIAGQLLRARRQVPAVAGASAAHPGVVADEEAQPE